MNIDRYSSIVSNWSPIAGLVATLFGMIRSFQHVAQSPTAPQFSEMLPYIGEALALTLILAIVVNVAAVLAAMASRTE